MRVPNEGNKAFWLPLIAVLNAILISDILMTLLLRSENPILPQRILRKRFSFLRLKHKNYSLKIFLESIRKAKVAKKLPWRF